MRSAIRTVGKDGIIWEESSIADMDVPKKWGLDGKGRKKEE
jgi:hypothetical protein